MLYIHVPTAWLAFLAFGVTALGSILYLVPKTRSLAWDRIAGASAEIGVSYTGLTLVAGAIWGRITWASTGRGTPGSPPRRCFRPVLGYLACGGCRPPTISGPALRHRRAHRSSTCRSSTAASSGGAPSTRRPRREIGDVQISGDMLFSLFVGVVAFTLVYLWLMVHKTRIARMEDALDDHGLELALEERRAEAALEEATR